MNKKITAFILTLSMILPAVVFADDTLTELAANQYAEASSELSADTAAEKANDGINDNADYTAWKSSQEDKRPYWQTDLTVAHKISKIVIEARKDGEAQERSDFRVLVSNDPEFSEYEIAGECKADFGANSEWTAEVKAKDRYQYVRVEKTVDGALSIGEIKIYAKTSSIYYGSDSPSANTQYPVTDEATRYELPKDVIGTDIEKEVRFISSLNIMRGYPDGNFLPDGYITRAEFATVAARLLNNTVHISSNSFKDVASDYWAYDAIETCYENGLINGVSEGYFAPDEAITYDQAVKIVVGVLGYGDVAQANGGYPSGYRQIASSLGILDGVANDNGQITRGNLAKMCYLSLFAKMLNKLEEDADDTLLSKVFKLSKTRGLVTEIKGLSLTNDSLNILKDDYFVVNDLKMTTDNPYYREWFGYVVEAYYRESYDGGYEAVVVIPDKKGTEIELNAEDVKSFDETGTLYYEDGSKEKKIKFNTDLDVIYNNKAYKSYTHSTLIPKYGTIRAIDYDEDGKYDIMIIRAVKTYVVNWVNAEDRAIYPKNLDNTAEKSIKYNDDDIVTLYNTEGEKIEFSDLKEWNVLSVEMSANISGERIADIYVSDVFARGEVTTVTDELVIIRSKEYKVADTLDISNIKPGDKGIFYLDYYGKIAAFEGDKKANGKYGFLTKVYEAEAGDGVYIHVFTASGSIERFKASEKLKIDGNEKTTKSDIMSALAASEWGKDLTAPVWNGVSQIIKYSSNAKSEILSIDTIAQGTNETDENLSRDFDNAGRTYVSNTAAFGMQLMLADDVFFVRCPDDWSEEGFEFVSKSSLESGVSHTFEAYDADSVNVASAAVMMPGIGLAPSVGARLAVVDDISQGMNDNEEIVQVMKCWYNGKLVEYKENEPGVMSPLNLKKGDIVAFALSSSNQIKSIEKRFYNEELASTPSGSISISKPIGPDNRDPSWNSCLYYGTVYSRKGDIVKIKLNAPDDYTYQYLQDKYKEIITNLSSIKNAYLYDSAENLVRLATTADFLDEETTDEGVKVVCQMGSSEVSQVVILK